MSLQIHKPFYSYFDDQLKLRTFKIKIDSKDNLFLVKLIIFC